MTTMQATTTLEVTVCKSCSGTFAVSKEVVDYAREQRRHAYSCPYCRTNWGFNYLLKQDANDVARAQRLQYEAEERMHAAQEKAETAERRRRAEKGAKTKIKKRIAAGVCPCCNRTFQNLARHMSGQHPEYVPTDTAEQGE